MTLHIDQRFPQSPPFGVGDDEEGEVDATNEIHAVEVVYAHADTGRRSGSGSVSSSSVTDQDVHRQHRPRTEKSNVEKQDDRCEKC